MFALQRVLAAVNTAVAAALGTHNLITLLDLERLVLAGSRDFEGVQSFEQLKLGPLRCHPLVVRHFPKAALTAEAAESKAADLSGAEIMQALAAGVDANWSGDPNAERKPFSMQDALQVLAQSKGLASADELPLFMRGSSHFVTGMLVRFTAARHKAETKAETSIAKDRMRAIERGKQQGAADAMRQLQEEARDRELARVNALMAAADGVDAVMADGEAGEGSVTSCETCGRDFGSKNALHAHLRLEPTHLSADRLLTIVQAVVREAQARGLPATELVAAQLRKSWPGERSGKGHGMAGLVLCDAAPLILAAVERLAAGRAALQADLLAEGADILAQLGSSAGAAAGAPLVRTAGALLDHIRSLHADVVADGTAASPLVLLATIEERLLRDLSYRSFAELRLEQSSFAAFVGKHAEALAELLPAGRLTAPPSGLPSAAALVRNADADTDTDADADADAPAVTMLGEFTADDARRAVLATPPLQCLGTATMWADVFEPRVGSMVAFLQSQPELFVLEVIGGGVVRLPRGGVEEFKQAKHDCAWRCA